MGIETQLMDSLTVQTKKCMKDSSDLSRTSTLDPKVGDYHQWI